MSVTKPAEILAHQAHRDWPVPKSPWVMAQTWRNLLFVHWPVPPDMLRPLIPSGLRLDTFEGQAWVGVVPFQITDIRPPLLPFMPFMSQFPELNVRTYVTDGVKPGVWFFSLDAGNRLAVEGARTFYHLPYFNTEMRVQAEGDTIHYVSRRTDSRIGAGEFRGSYRPTTPVYLSEPGTLDSWLTERYCLYCANRRGKIYRAEIHHFKWPLQRAEAELQVNTVADAFGIQLPDIPPLLHFARQIDVLTWYIKSL